MYMIVSCILHVLRKIFVDNFVKNSLPYTNKLPIVVDILGEDFKVVLDEELKSAQAYLEVGISL